MLRIKTGWIIIFLLVITQAYAQRLVEGRILDADTKKPVPFASIGVINSSKGTSSNLYGEFAIDVPKEFTLQVSSIGYESTRVDSIPSDGIILMKSRSTQLDPIVISAKPVNPYRIVRRALSNINVNYNTSPFMQTFFYRHYCKDGNVYGRLVEASVDVWKEKGYKSTQTRVGESDQIRITQLRRSLDKTAMAQGHEPISVGSILEADIAGFQSRLDRQQLSFFSNVSNLKYDLENYNLTFDKITYYDGLELYEIHYEYKMDSVLLSSGQYQMMSHTEGRLYIETKSLAIVKSEQTRQHQDHKINTSTYYKLHEGKYYPYHFIIDGEDQVSESEGHAYHIELVSVEIKDNQSEKFVGRIPSQEDLLKIPYDSSFWHSSNVLKTTPLEDEIINDLGGGSSLNRQFYRYQQFQMAIRDGGIDGEEKFKWLADDSRNTRTLYVMFWSENFRPYWFDLEYAKQLHKQFKNDITFVLISLDDDQERWLQTVEKYSLFIGGIVNYRVGSNSMLVKKYEVLTTPAFILLSRNGEIKKANRPSDPTLKKDLELIASKD